MSDIADKIYAATGLTLGAEEAAKIGQMIQVENEKLRAKQADRIAELEAALRFYDDEENWRRNGQLDPDGSNFTGGPARAALAGGKKDE